MAGQDRIQTVVSSDGGSGSVRAGRDGRLQEILARHPVRPARAASGFDIKVIYTPEDLEGIDYERDIGLPGSPPFTRGVYPTMYRGQLWTMRMYSGLASAERSNERFRFLLKEGQTGLSVAFDLPTQMGYDSDSPRAEGEVGRVGVPVSSLRDMEILFDGIPLEKISTSFTINATAPIILAMYIVVGERQGVPRERLRGTVQNDILKEYIARKAFIFPPEPSLRLACDIIEFCARELPSFYPISVCGYHIQQAGASPAQEIAYGLSSALAYIDEVVRRGLAVDQFASRFSFNWAVTHEYFFEEIAKLRACRRLWARLLQERYGAKEPRSMMMRFFSGGSGWAMAAREPLNNIVRATLQTLAAVLAGVQAVHVVAYDEAVAIPTEESARIALRTQQIIAYETDIPSTVDPLGGSYFIERLTSDMEERIREEMEEVSRQGGMVAAIERGFIQRRIFERYYAIEKAIQNGEKVIVGQNRFADENAAESEVAAQEIDEAAVERQLERLRQVRRERDGRAAAEALRQVEKAARNQENIMPALIEAVKAYATVGEISDVLRDVYGTYSEAVAF